jgi:hypothetical protein
MLDGTGQRRGHRQDNAGEKMNALKMAAAVVAALATIISQQPSIFLTFFQNLSEG